MRRVTEQESILVLESANEAIMSCLAVLDSLPGFLVETFSTQEGVEEGSNCLGPAVECLLLLLLFNQVYCPYRALEL